MLPDISNDQPQTSSPLTHISQQNKTSHIYEVGVPTTWAVACQKGWLQTQKLNPDTLRQQGSDGAERMKSVEKYFTDVFLTAWSASQEMLQHVDQGKTNKRGFVKRWEQRRQ